MHQECYQYKNSIGLRIQVKKQKDFAAILILAFIVIVYLVIQTMMAIDDIFGFVLSLSTSQLTAILISSLVIVFIFLHHIINDLKSYRGNDEEFSIFMIFKIMMNIIQDVKFMIPVIIISLTGYYSATVDIHDDVESLMNEKRYLRAWVIAQKQCNQDSGKGCWYAGLLAHQGLGVTRDQVKSESLFKKSCNLKHIESCAKLGAITWKQDKYQESFDYYLMSCEGSDLEGCFWVAYHSASAKGVKRDLKFAARTYLDTCTKGHAKSCHYASVNFKKGYGVPQDLEKSAIFKAKACSLGYVHDCEE